MWVAVAMILTIEPHFRTANITHSGPKSDSLSVKTYIV